jgi:hypothetical protein
VLPFEKKFLTVLSAYATHLPYVLLMRQKNIPDEVEVLTRDIYTHMNFSFKRKKNSRIY